VSYEEEDTCVYVLSLPLWLSLSLALSLSLRRRIHVWLSLSLVLSLSMAINPRILNPKPKQGDILECDLSDATVSLPPCC